MKLSRIPCLKIQFSRSTEAKGHVIYSETLFILGLATLGRSMIFNGWARVLGVTHALVFVIERTLILHIFTFCDCLDIRILQVVTEPFSFDVKLADIMVLTRSRLKKNTVWPRDLRANLRGRNWHGRTREGLRWGLMLLDEALSWEPTLPLFLNILEYLIARSQRL